MMKTCLFCRNTCIYSIHNGHGNNSTTSKDDMLQFFGYQIENHLRPDDAICNLCMHIMDSVAKLKRRLLPLIFRSDCTDIEDCKPHNLGKKWNTFASVNFEEDTLGYRTPTPTSLVKFKGIDYYETALEWKIDQIERQRSQSCRSEARSEANSEVAEAFSGVKRRKRKRGHGWTRRRSGRYSSLSTGTRKSARNLSRSQSLISNINISPITLTVQCVEDNSGPYYTEELHQCSVKGCNFICEDINLMSWHKTTKHQHLALFYCDFCGKKYTESADLEIHKRTHSGDYPCAICHQEFHFEEDLKEHWKEHVRKAVTCKFCGKRYVNEKVCVKHQKNVHKRDIPSRFDYKPGAKQSLGKEVRFEVRHLVQEPSLSDSLQK